MATAYRLQPRCCHPPAAPSLLPALYRRAPRSRSRILPQPPHPLPPEPSPPRRASPARAPARCLRVWRVAAAHSAPVPPPWWSAPATPPSSQESVQGQAAPPPRHLPPPPLPLPPETGSLPPRTPAGRRTAESLRNGFLLGHLSQSKPREFPGVTPRKLRDFRSGSAPGHKDCGWPALPALRRESRPRQKSQCLLPWACRPAVPASCPPPRLPLP